jgi:hypothetical protein
VRPGRRIARTLRQRSEAPGQVGPLEGVGRDDLGPVVEHVRHGRAAAARLARRTSAGSRQWVPAGTSSATKDERRTGGRSQGEQPCAACHSETSATAEASRAAGPRGGGGNLLLLLWIALIPWPTRLVAEYMREGGDGERVAALVYAGTMTMMGIAFAVLWSYASRGRRLLGGELSDAEIAHRTRRFTIGAPIYAVSIVVALFSAPACLAIIAALAVYYALPQGGMMRGPSG